MPQLQYSIERYEKYRQSIRSLIVMAIFNEVFYFNMPTIFRMFNIKIYLKKKHWYLKFYMNADTTYYFINTFKYKEIIKM